MRDKCGRRHSEAMTKDATRNPSTPGLRLNAALLRTVLHNFPNGSVNIFDRDLRYLLAEGRGLAAIGLSSEQLVGKTLAELFPCKAADHATAHYQRVLAGEDVEFELYFQEHHYVINASPFIDDNGVILGVVAVVRDITERKRLERMRESSWRPWHMT